MNSTENEVDAVMAFISQGHHSVEAIRDYLTDTINALTSQAYREALEAAKKAR